MDKITQALESLFAHHRIVFWYDAGEELRADYEALHLPGVEKIELANNQFGTKHRILKAQPEGRFLLYQADERPAGCLAQAVATPEIV